MACRFCILTPKIGMAWMALNNQAGEQLLLITATTVHRRSYRAALLHDKKKRPALLQQGSWLGILVLWLIIPQSMGNFQIRCTRASSAPPLSPQGTQKVRLLLTQLSEAQLTTSYRHWRQPARHHVHNESAVLELQRRRREPL